MCFNLLFGFGYCVLGFSVWFCFFIVCLDLHVVFYSDYNCVFVFTDMFRLLLCVGS